MGTYVDYCGDMNIPEDKREEFLSRVKKLTNLGGMMRLHWVETCGDKLLMLKPLEIDKDISTNLNFNYFEDDAWETATFSGKDMCLYSSGKVGEREFYDAMIALCSLYAIYDKDPGRVIDNDRDVPWEKSMGWINYLFGTKYCERDVTAIKKKQYASTEPFPEIKTSEYFRQTGYTAFWKTPSQMENEPENNYFLTDDDRLYWWDGTDEVVMSVEADSFFRMYGKMVKLMVKNEEYFESVCEGKISTAESFPEDFTNLLLDIDNFYKRIFPFESMFNEFIENKEKVEYRAAAGILHFLAETYRGYGEVINRCGSWDIASKNIICNEGRMKIKRYLAVMANKKLRMKYFGF